MPKTKNALLRYTVLDTLFRKNRYHDTDEILRILHGQLGDKISKAQLDKDIRALRTDYKAPIENKKNLGYRYSDLNFSIKIAPIDLQDKQMLQFAVQVFRTFRESPLLEHMQETVDKLLANAGLQEHTGNQDTAFIQLETPNNNLGTRWLEIFIDAIREKETLETMYHGYNKKPGKRVLSPYFLKEYRNLWYVVAYDHDSTHKDKVLVFALDRMVSPRRSKREYIPPPPGLLEEYFRYSFGVHHRWDRNPETIKLRFTGKIIPYIKNHTIHHSQKILREKPGQYLDISIRVQVAAELISALLGYGSQVKVLGPKSLAAALLNDVKETIKQYENLDCK